MERNIQEITHIYLECIKKTLVKKYPSKFHLTLFLQLPVSNLFQAYL